MRQENVMLPMQDGVKLATYIYFPEGDGPWPTMFARHPYGHDTIDPAMFEAKTQAGYIAIFQDERGRFESEGEFFPWKNSGVDGAYTCDWIARQSWSNGKIGGFSLSYGGITQWLAARHAPKSLKVISPVLAGAPFTDIPYVAPGVISLGIIIDWTLSVAGDICDRNHKDLEHSEIRNAIQACNLANAFTKHSYTPSKISTAWEDSDFIAAVERFTDSVASILKQPLFAFTTGVGGNIPWVKEWLEHPESGDAVWLPRDYSQYYDKFDCAALIVCGWYDQFSKAGPRDFSELAKRDKTGKKHKLVIGPWGHNAITTAVIVSGQREFPWPDLVGDQWNVGGNSLSNEPDLIKRWHDYHLKGEENGVKDGAPISLYVMGENVLRDEYEWPLARTEWTRFYLHSDGSANTLNGDGSLSTEQPADEAPDRFSYDPANPVPTCGGHTASILTSGAYDQREVEQREDVLVYSTPPLKQDIEVTGPIVLTLWAATSAVDTDFTAKLVDVQLDGLAYNLADGVTRLRFRTDKKGLVIPGELQEVTIELSPTSNLFKAGHQIRLEVSSSNFPYFDPNPNTGKSLFLDESNEMIVAEQTVYHDAIRPSHLILPIIPR